MSKALLLIIQLLIPIFFLLNARRYLRESLQELDGQARGGQHRGHRAGAHQGDQQRPVSKLEGEGRAEREDHGPGVQGGPGSDGQGEGGEILTLSFHDWNTCNY